ncbi:2',5'-phosphodiesterase 12-like [Argiope bruennichi]|uniref:2',5'-phosphodiesterase 12-like n=1 Tax=Argiope bruennichi TaxID=94029 RepID=UPI00249454D5|nr:2',5'-phosphodiesterase 12-like [Argiope bruennichi]
MKYFFPSYSFCRLIFSYKVVQSSRAMSQCAKVFVKHIEDESKMKIYFSLALPDLPERTFTFLRSKEEKLEVTISRMKLKILEAVNNKLNKKKKKKISEIVDENDCQFSLNLSLLKDGKVIDNELRNMDAWTENAQLKINDHVYKIAENPPSVLHLSLPKSIMSGFPVYPKVELEYCSKEQCDFTWYRSITKAEKPSLDMNKILNIKNENWLILSKNYFYITSESDVGCKLRVSCVPKSGEKIGLEEIAVSTNPIQAGPEKCPFEQRHEFTKNLTEPGILRCVSYNILADLYADSETARTSLFPYCPAEYLMLDYRKQLYLKEIMGYNADMICLQEVDRKVFYGDLVPVLTSTGLEGIYSEKGGQVVEGLSLFYRTSKFKVVEFQAKILSDAVVNEPILKPIHDKLIENEKLKERFMNRTTAIQVVLLESIDVPQKRILVGNTHLYFHPDSDNIRLLQATSCIMYLEDLLIKYQKENPSYTTSLILCGDFNSCPEFGVYKFMTEGYLKEDCIDWQSNPEEIVPGIQLKHSLSIASACGTPTYTNYTEGFVGCLDYIFYNKAHLEVKEVVPLPDHEQVIKYKALPNKVFPSDHIALVCTLGWK